jgi:ubiquinone/menaquinone biosynthesis C-methylase UbiE
MRVFTLSTTLLLAAIAWSPSFSQDFNKESLAPYIPSPEVVVEKMLEAGRVKPGDIVYDLGSGDGRIVITAAEKFGARAVGVELRSDLCKMTEQRVKALGLEDRVKVIHGNLMKVDLSPADVVTLYLLTSSNEKIRPNLEKYLKPGARVVSNDFQIRGWKPSEVVRITAGGLLHNIYVYEIAKK